MTPLRFSQLVRVLEGVVIFPRVLSVRALAERGL